MQSDLLYFETQKKKKTKTITEAAPNVDAVDIADPLDFGTKKKKKAKPLDLEVSTVTVDETKDDVRSLIFQSLLLSVSFRRV